MANGGSVVERGCSLLVSYDKQASQKEIKEALESGEDEEKAEALKQTISLLLSGEALPQVFLTIVRYVLPSEDHTVQRLLLLYLEIVEKHDSNGKVLPEMILICQNLRNNLQHPNEYMRGVTLRFLCRLKEAELLEPLVPSVVQNLEHRHSYVRRNAVLAVDSISRLEGGTELLGDGPELIDRFIQNESNISACRNAFVMLSHNAQDRAIKFLSARLDLVSSWGEILQTVVLELVRKVCKQSPNERGKYIGVIIALLSTSSTAVLFEGASSLVALSSAPTAVRAAVQTYTQLLSSVSDNNVKLIILDRLHALHSSHPAVLCEHAMEILRALSAPSIDIRRKALSLALSLLSKDNAQEVVGTLKKELLRTQGRGTEGGEEYRQLLVRSVHECVLKHPSLAGNVVHLLLDLVGDGGSGAAEDIALVLREIMETDEGLRSQVLERLLDCLRFVKGSHMCAGILWILGEYSLDPGHVRAALSGVREAFGDPSIHNGHTGSGTADQNDRGAADANRGEQATQKNTKPVVLADGTYSTQSAELSNGDSKGARGNVGADETKPPLRRLIEGGEFHLAALFATTLTKLALRLSRLEGVPKVEANQASAEAMLSLTCLLNLGDEKNKANEARLQMDTDASEKVAMCLNLLAHPTEELALAITTECRKAFARVLKDKQKEAETREKEKAGTDSEKASADDLIDFSHLKSRKGMSQVELEDEIESDLKRATGEKAAERGEGTSKTRMMQLTGLSDPVFAEALVVVHQYDIVLDISLINRTDETLQNVALELSTIGDLKLVERPQPQTLAEGAQATIRCNVKVSSTETGVIFGSVSLESSSGRKKSVTLKDVHMDVMDYIFPSSLGDDTFRQMWSEFEWENKVSVSTKIGDLRRFIDHIQASTNMHCLTTLSALEGNSSFLAANLYARSVFGEDALANVSIEKQSDGKLSGNVRIRSKMQGIALSLGDRVNSMQSKPLPVACS